MIERKKTKEILADSFFELAQYNAVDKITISDIVKNCGFSNATFYRQFKDKYDLIIWDYNRKISHIVDETNGERKDIINKYIDYLLEDKAYIKNLLNHTKGYEAFMNYMQRINIEMLSKYLSESIGDIEQHEDLLLCIKLYCYGATQMICEWILGSLKTDREKLTAVISKSLDDVLKSYLK